MRQFFLRALAFLLGIKYKTPEELRNEGEEITKARLLKKLSSRISIDELKSIWLIGAIEFSLLKARDIKELHDKGLRYDFGIPTNFNYEGDYIDFYQVSTETGRYYLIAMSATFSLSKEDEILMFLEISPPYPTSHLDKKLLYYG